MEPRRLSNAAAREGQVLSRDVRSGAAVLLSKGKLLTEADAAALRALPPLELHVLEPGEGDLHEDPAGRRLAAAVAGEGVEVQPPAGGTVPLAARWRGILEVDAARLAALNDLDDLAVATLPHEQIVVEGDLVARVKIVPFIIASERVRLAEELGRPGGLLSVRRFVPLRVAAVVEDRLDPETLARFRRDFEEKLRFFGSTLLPLSPSGGSAEALGESISAAIAGGAQLVLVAAGRAMDPLDPALIALERAGGRLLKNGIPAHPGALLWLGAIGEVAVVGVPSCGVLSRPTALDLLLPRLLTGEPPTRNRMVALGAGGMLTRESSHRLPPYRRPGPRGELEPA